MDVTVTWKKALVGIAIVLAIGGGSYYAGKKSQPDLEKFKQTDTYKWDLKLDNKTTTQQDYVFDWSKVSNIKVSTKTTKTTVEKPGGEKITTEVTETNAQTDTKEANKGTVDTTVKSETVIADKGEVTKTVDLTVKNNTAKNWSVQVGAEVSLTQVRHLNLTPTYYVSGSRRLFSLGPIDFGVGAGVNTEMTVTTFIEGSF